MTCDRHYFVFIIPPWVVASQMTLPTTHLRLMKVLTCEPQRFWFGKSKPAPLGATLNSHQSSSCYARATRGHSTSWQTFTEIDFQAFQWASGKFCETYQGCAEWSFNWVGRKSVEAWRSCWYLGRAHELRQQMGAREAQLMSKNKWSNIYCRVSIALTQCAI